MTTREKIFFDKKLSWGLVAYDNIAELQNIITKAENPNLEISVTYNTRISKNIAFLLGCLHSWGKLYGKDVKFIVSDNTYKHIRDLNVIENPEQPKKNRRFKILQHPREAIDLSLAIINEAPVKMKNDLKESLASKIGEMYINAFEHSESLLVIGGNYFNSTKNGKRKYTFTCYDAGIGIIKKVQIFNQGLSDTEALQWAIIKGNSTQPIPGVTRGCGLDLLHNFTQVNEGSIRICSNNLYYEFNGQSESQKFRQLKNIFYGTAFEMDFIASDSMYIFKK